MILDHRMSGISAKQTYTTLKLADLSNPFIIRDIHNKRQADRLRELDGKPPINALLKVLINKIGPKRKFRIWYNTRSGIDDGGPLTHLFIAHEKHIDLLQENHQVLITDGTYKTNIF